MTASAASAVAGVSSKQQQQLQRAEEPVTHRARAHRGDLHLGRGVLGDLAHKVERAVGAAQHRGGSQAPCSAALVPTTELLGRLWSAQHMSSALAYTSPWRSYCRSAGMPCGTPVGLGQPHSRSSNRPRQQAAMQEGGLKRPWTADPDLVRGAPGHSCWLALSHPAPGGVQAQDSAASQAPALGRKLHTRGGTHLRRGMSCQLDTSRPSSCRKTR